MLAEKAGLILRPAGDAQHVFVPQQGRELVKLGNCRASVHHVATLEGRASPGQDCIRPLPDRGGLRFSYHGTVRGGELARQRLRDFHLRRLGCTLARPHDAEIIRSDKDSERHEAGRR